jgi:hypothetical protein
VKEKIIEALGKLDPANDEHWTSAGLPKVEAVAGLAELPDLTRKDITEAAPDVVRDRSGIPILSPLEAFTEPEAKPDVAVETDRSVILEQKRLELMNEMSKVQSERIKLQNIERELNRKIDAIINEKERLKPAHAEYAPIAEYLEQEQKRREERGKHITEMVQAGIITEAEAGLFASPIDLAMARKRGYGRTRPAFPMVGKTR